VGSYSYMHILKLSHFHISDSGKLFIHAYSLEAGKTNKPGTTN